MSGIYEQLGIRTIINAKGASTRVSGGILAPEVADAMRDASRHCVDMWEIQGRASEIIANLTGAEAAIVTSGAAAGLLLGTAACIAGLDPTKMNRLPDTSGMKDQVVMARSHRNFYDHAVRTAGAKLVEVGIADRFSGAGVRDAEAWEIAAAITEKTAAILYLAQPNSRPALGQVVKVAQAAGVPVLVDAASQLPPAENLRRFIDEGADLVTFSGGKAIGGPQSSGILCGRRELVASAALQCLDQDLFFEQWTPPPSLIEKSDIPGLPHHGIGRPCKAGKEEIAGLLTALRLFVADDAQARRQTVRAALARELYDALKETPHTQCALVPDSYRPGIPGVRMTLDETAAGKTALQVILELQNGDPSIHADNSRIADASIGFSSMCLEAGHPAAIAARMSELLK